MMALCTDKRIAVALEPVARGRPTYPEPPVTPTMTAGAQAERGPLRSPSAQLLRRHPARSSFFGHERRYPDVNVTTPCGLI